MKKNNYYLNKRKVIYSIDYKTTFIKTVFDELKRIYKSVGWSSFNPADDFGCSMLDLLGCL